MANEEDWKELEKWQKEEKLRDSTNRIGSEFNKKDIKLAKRITLAIKAFISSISVTFLLFAVIVFVIALLFIYVMFKSASPINMEKYLADIYKGQKFTILEHISEEKMEENGLYIMAARDNKDIIFKAYKKNKGLEQDFSEQRLKYYIENCSDKLLIKDLVIEESTRKIHETDFLKYEVYLDINNYIEINKACEKAYNIVSYLVKQDKTMYEPIIIRYKEVGYYQAIRCNEVVSLENEIYKAKYEYIRKMKEDNNLQELNRIGAKEIDEYWKPEKLELVINGQNIKLVNGNNAYTRYDRENREYQISGIGDLVLNSINNIEILKVNKFSGAIKKVKYKNKIYRVKSDKYRKNIIYIGGNIEQFLECFDNEIIYDLKNEKIYINIK